MDWPPRFAGPVRFAPVERPRETEAEVRQPRHTRRPARPCRLQCAAGNSRSACARGQSRWDLTGGPFETTNRCHLRTARWFRRIQAKRPAKCQTAGAPRWRTTMSRCFHASASRNFSRLREEPRPELASAEVGVQFRFRDHDARVGSAAFEELEHAWFPTINSYIQQ